MNWPMLGAWTVGTFTGSLLHPYSSALAQRIVHGKP